MWACALLHSLHCFGTGIYLNAALYTITHLVFVLSQITLVAVFQLSQPYPCCHQLMIIVHRNSTTQISSSRNDTWREYIPYKIHIQTIEQNSHCWPLKISYRISILQIVSSIFVKISRPISKSGPTFRWRVIADTYGSRCCQLTTECSTECI